MPKKRKIVDWDAIEREYRAGQLSNVEIGSMFNLSETAIRKHAKKYEWKKDLAAKVKKAVKEKLVRGEVRADDAKDEEIVEEAAGRGAAVQQHHRKDIASARTIVNLLMGQLGDAAGMKSEMVEAIILETMEDVNGKGDPSEVRRNKMLKAVALPSLVGVIRDLSVALKNLVTLERQAYNLNDGSGEGDDEPLDTIRLIFEKGDGEALDENH